MSDQWLVMVSNHKLLEELRRFTDDEISNYGGLDEVSPFIRYTYAILMIQFKIAALRNLLHWE